MIVKPNSIYSISLCFSNTYFLETCLIVIVYQAKPIKTEKELLSYVQVSYMIQQQIPVSTNAEKQSENQSLNLFIPVS